MEMLTVKNLILWGCHGACPGEQEKKQRFQVDIQVETDFTEAVKGDDLTLTVDYDQVKEVVAAVVERSTYKLIETMAAVIAQQILVLPRVKNVAVKVTKLDRWNGNGAPGVRVTRFR